MSRHFIVTCCVTFFCLTAVKAEPVPYPQDRPALRLYLADGRQQSFTLHQLQRFPQSTIRLRDASGKEQLWMGVSLPWLLQSMDEETHDRPVYTRSLNHYSVVIPAADIQRYQPLIAYQRDGQFLSIRDLGPLYLIYPLDDYPELHQQVFYNRSVWQLSEIHVE